ncbi:MAG: hypothetical protein M3Y81_20590 [Chloroflexota bacterium]|nr:hypothetical protein [Chloroflexota bacterium]
MRKALLIVAALSFVFYSVSLAEARLQATLVLLIPAAVNIALSFFQQDIDAKVILSIDLILPLSLLLYAIVSTDFERLVAS